MKKKPKPNYDKPATIIHHDTRIDLSQLASKSSVQVNGILNGDMEVQESIVVGEAGHINGNMKAAFVLVAGHVEGNIVVEEQIHLTKSAKVRGDIQCRSMIVDEGAFIEGSFKMLGDGAKAPEKEA